MDRCSLQCIEDELNAWATACPASTDLEVPKPDITPACKAMVGYCQAKTVWMSASAATIERLAKMQPSKQSRAFDAKPTPAADAKKAQLSAEVWTAPLHLLLLLCSDLNEDNSG